MRIFLGKFSNKYPEQIEKKYYAAGKKGNPWYGGLEPGDYVFVSYIGKIIALWQADEYTETPNPINPNGVLSFREIKTYEDVSTANHFTRYKHFIHDLNLVNKVTKSVKNLGFIPILTTENCPEPQDIDFKSGTISIYIATEEANIDYTDGDIRVTVDSTDEVNIRSIDKYINGKFNAYKEFIDLYEERNREDGKFSIKELYNFSIQDNATNKRKFLSSLIEELVKNGYMEVSNPISLYDNLLVGRKRSGAGAGNTNLIITPSDDSDDDGFDEDYEKFATLLNYNPNLILYGPPGTGKTYATKKIINAFEKKYYNRSSNFEKADSEDRIRYITFHQSYSYEEFIEGIRPILGEDEVGKLGYKLENGVFKDHSINAEKELIKKKDNNKYVDRITSVSKVWKVSLGSRNDVDTYNKCIETNDIAINYNIEEDVSGYTQEEIMHILQKDTSIERSPVIHANTIYALASLMGIGDIVMIYDGPTTVRMIGIINGDYRYDDNFIDFKHRRKVEWLKNLNYPIDIFKYNGNVRLTLKTIYQLTNMEVSDVIKIISENSLEENFVQENNIIRPYYMIIDEINRGNISKIFGELITLIEQDKRGVLRVLLPYSKKEFTVPSNLYIIGTMNTADRSIATLDTALRRRFTFVEIEPDSSIISLSDNPVINKIDLSKLLDVINNKIVERYDRDHRIGHSYFLGIDSLNNLYQTWFYKILPLLNEYFYNDLESLTYVVGKDFYDINGNIKYLSLSKREDGQSDFEEKLINIYQV